MSPALIHHPEQEQTIDVHPGLLPTNHAADDFPRASSSKNVTRKVRIISFFRVEQQQETYNILESWTSLAKVLSTCWNKIPVDQKWPEKADDIRGT
jgi:hypothetical protein